MKGKSPNSFQQNLLFPNLLDQLNPKHPLLKLAQVIPWDYFENEFKSHYASTGRPAKLGSRTLVIFTISITSVSNINPHQLPFASMIKS